MAAKVLSRLWRRPRTGRIPVVALTERREALHCLWRSFCSEPATSSSIRWMFCPLNLRHSTLGNIGLQRFGFSSYTESNQTSKEQEIVDSDKIDAKKEDKDEVPDTSEKVEDTDEEIELTIDDLIKLVDAKEEQLKLKHKEIEKMQDKVLRSYAEMENVIDRTKREAENSKKFAIQNFAKSLLDVADNLERASNVVKESFSKIDASKDSAGAVPLLKTLLEGVEMTNKQLAEVFRKFGIEKFDPMDEHFDPHRHHAVFRIPNASKPPGTVAAVLKPGYTLYERVIRPAEVGVTEALNDEGEKNSVE